MSRPLVTERGATDVGSESLKTHSPVTLSAAEGSKVAGGYLVVRQHANVVFLRKPTRLLMLMLMFVHSLCQIVCHPDV